MAQWWEHFFLIYFFIYIFLLITCKHKKENNAYSTNTKARN